MALRLPHVLVAMALILCAGMVSVSVLEAEAGAAEVPGLVLVDAPFLASADLLELLDRWPAAALERVVAADAPFAPFEEAALARRVEGGGRTVLFARAPDLDGESLRRAADGRVAWQVVVPAEAAAWSAGSRSEGVAHFVRSQRAPLPFTVGVSLSPQPRERVADMVDDVAQAFDGLPPWRRGVVVVLGAPGRDDAAGHRPVLRVEVGPHRKPPRPGLIDLTNGSS